MIGDKASVVYQTDQLREPRIREALTLYSPSDNADRTAEINEARWELAEILAQHSLTIQAHKAFLCPGECSIKLARSAAKAESQALNGNSSGHMLASRDAYLHQNSNSFLDTEHKLDSNLRYAGHNPESLPDTIDLAQKAATAGDFEGALVEYSRALGLRQSEDVRAKWIQSKNAIASGALDIDKRNYNEALALLLKLQKMPGYAKPESESYLRISFAIADVLTLLHRYDEAEHEIDALVSKQNHTPQAYAGRGIILAEQGKFDEAVNSLKQALSLPGAQGAEINQALANIYISTGHFREAEHLLR
jgi:tetratricopeptide (TPR) repeat protein